jgi:hypothetical protein
LAALITDRFALPVTLVSGDRGEFSIFRDGVLIAGKTSDGFPSPAAVLERLALS